MSDFVISQIRTYTPMAVGAVAAFLIAHGVNLSNEALVGLTAFLSALLSGLYYLLVRLWEKKNPEAGIFLGVVGRPKYEDHSNK